MSPITTARSTSSSSPDAVVEVIDGLGSMDPKLLLFFGGIDHDGQVIGQALARRFPGAHIVGCSTNGEFTDQGFGKGGVVAVAIGPEKIASISSVFASLDRGVETGISAAAAKLSRGLGSRLHELDPQKVVGLALLEGAHGQEERITDHLGNVAPMLPFVGASAGDDIKFEQTWTVHAHRGECHFSHNACALVVFEARAPFQIFMTSSARPSGHEMTVTKAQPEKRLILELDGQPAARRYAEVLGVSREQLSLEVFIKHPLGLMLDDEPWLRSAVRAAENDSLFLACAIPAGRTLQVMNAGDLVKTTELALARAQEKMGCKASAGIFFNCVARLVEAKMDGIEAQYHAELSHIPHAGMHSNGECFLSHVNHTLSGVLFG